MGCDWWDCQTSLACEWIGSSAKSAPNLSKNGFGPNQIMIRKASTSCNHVCMDAMQDKQKLIGDEWAVIGLAGSLWIDHAIEIN